MAGELKWDLVGCTNLDRGLVAKNGKQGGDSAA